MKRPSGSSQLPTIESLEKIRQPVKDGGVCIYCGWNGGADGLRSEHIIPYSLGGSVELLGASCTECEGKINPVEAYLANSVFKDFRVHLGLQSRSGHPSTLTTTALTRLGPQKVDLAPKDHPYFLNMPTWRPAGYRRGAAIEEPFGLSRRFTYWSIPKNIRQTLNLSDGEYGEIADTSEPIDIQRFARGLTKIAYCDAVRAHGLKGFRPLLSPDIILGKYPHVAFFVGSEPSEPPPPDPPHAQHMVQHHTVRFRNQTLLSATIRLFGDSGTKEHGTPLYHVIYGAPGPRKSIPMRRVPRLPRQILL
jgi:hypothetical protein